MKRKNVYEDESAVLDLSPDMGSSEYEKNSSYTKSKDMFEEDSNDYYERD